MIYHFFLPLILLFSASCGPAQEQEVEATAQSVRLTTIILVRHAEKGPGDDPELTAEGNVRAERLREMLAGTELAAVYATDTRRTQATAGPTATDHRIQITSYSPDDLGELARQLRRMHEGKTVLVVGHSNTTPALVDELLGHAAGVTIDLEDYGNLLVATLPHSGQGRLLQLRY